MAVRLKYYTEPDKTSSPPCRKTTEGRSEAASEGNISKLADGTVSRPVKPPTDTPGSTKNQIKNGVSPTKSSANDDEKGISARTSDSQSSIVSETYVDPLKLVFDSIKDHYDSLSLKTLFDELIKRGICPNEDVRLTPVTEALDKIYKGRRISDIVINYKTFQKISGPASTFLVKVLNNKLAIQDTEEWTKCLFIYHEAIKEITGKNFAVSLTSADGQQMRWGPTKGKFPLNELVHVITYLMATDTLGFSPLHEAVGLEPKPTSEWEPRNPLVGAGALAVAAQLVNLAWAGKKPTERHETVRKIITDMTGGKEVLFDSKAFVGSGKKSEYLKAVLSWIMGNENQDFSRRNVDQVVQFYLESSSLQLDVDSLSTLGATLANGGVCATTGTKIFCSECVEKVLSVMTISGGKPGVPVMASSSGAVLLVVPAIFGLAVYSEDPTAPSYFMSAMFQHFALNQYERIFLRMIRPEKSSLHMEEALFLSARTGDLLTLSSLLDAGVNLSSTDYMTKTVMHVAAAHGHSSYISFLVNFCPNLVTAKDIMGNTPLDEARFFKHQDTVRFLENWEAVSQTSIK